MATDIRRLRLGGHGPGRSRTEIAGLDALESPSVARESWLRRTWAATWPKATALGIVLLAWEAVVWTGWRPSYVLPPPSDVFARLWADLGTAELWQAIAITLRRGAWGFAIAIAIGVGVGALVSQFRVMRSAIGSLITGLQTMPSIAWFPLAILLFKLSEEAITFVVVLGAAPAIANGLIPAGILTLSLVALYYTARKKYRATNNEAVQAVFVLLATAFAVLTVVGVWFRGSGMGLVWPWNL